MDKTATLRVYVDYRGGTEAAAIKIDEPFIQQFQPIDICDDPLMAVVTGGLTQDQARVFMALRTTFATELSAKLTEHIVSIMKSKDTINGYPTIEGAHD